MPSYMDNENSTFEGEIVYDEPLEMLDEAEHKSNVDLVREINKLRREINRLRK